MRYLSFLALCAILMASIAPKARAEERDRDADQWIRWNWVEDSYEYATEDAMLTPNPVTGEWGYTEEGETPKLNTYENTWENAKEDETPRLNIYEDKYEMAGEDEELWYNALADEYQFRPEMPANNPRAYDALDQWLDEDEDTGGVNLDPDRFNPDRFINEHEDRLQKLWGEE